MINYEYIAREDTICALSTVPGKAAIAVVRMSGPMSFAILEDVFKPANKKFKLSEAQSHTIHLGMIAGNEEMIDEVLVSLFRKPHSYTGENLVEISCHGSIYIQQKLVELLIAKGARLANPGEFTFRAFMNGKFDLSQAEAVSDLIDANSKAAHDLALEQMRGGYSGKIKKLREQLLNFASLIELELDFSEEDVEFANRAELSQLLESIENEITQLIESFKQGSVLKHGVPVAIIGKPNVGKSTLMNALLDDERAIVSEIPGTTRDTIEDLITVNGVTFRFIDTAGLRQSEDVIESIGVERTYNTIEKAAVVLFVFDVSETSPDEIVEILNDFKEHIKKPGKKFIVIANKTDKLVESPRHFRDLVELETIFISAKRKENIHLIADSLLKAVQIENITDSTIISNVRHMDALSKTLESVYAIERSFEQNVSTDLLAIDLRQALHHLGEITGEVTVNEVLNNIFGNFCVGK